MSICVNFHSQKRLEPKQIFDAMLKRGEAFMITSDEFPHLRFGTIRKALRGVEINNEGDSYEVRVCTFANRADLQLFATVIDTMTTLTGSQGFYENDEEQPVAAPLQLFNDEWITEQIETSLNVTCALLKMMGAPITMYGLFFPFCVGPRLLESFDIFLYDTVFDEPSIEDMHCLQDYLAQLQWQYVDKKDTSSRLRISNPDDPDAKSLTLSVIYAKDGKVEPFDYISHADLLCLMDMDKQEPVLVKMVDARKICDPQFFSLMDESQLSCEKPLTYKEFSKMCELAQLYQVNNWHHRHTFPGAGYDPRQQTFVLMWNPAISSVKLEDHISDIPHLMTAHFDWSVFEHEKARKGDRFVLVRCGEGNTGIVASGIFDSNPYQGRDWSGRGRKVFYMDMTPNFIADPDHATIITTEELTRVIPSFDWTGGHSGRLLTATEAQELDELMHNYLKQFVNNIDGKTINAFDLPTQ